MSIAFYLLCVCARACMCVCTCSHALVYVGKHVTGPIYGIQKTTCKLSQSFLGEATGVCAH